MRRPKHSAFVVALSLGLIALIPTAANATPEDASVELEIRSPGQTEVVLEALVDGGFAPASDIADVAYVADAETLAGLIDSTRTAAARSSLAEGAMEIVGFGEVDQPTSDNVATRGVKVGTTLVWVYCEVTPNQPHATGSGSSRGVIYKARVQCQRSTGLANGVSVLIGGTSSYYSGGLWRTGASDLHTQNVEAHFGTLGPVKTWYMARSSLPKAPLFTSHWKTSTVGQIQTPLTGSLGVAYCDDPYLSLT